MNVLRLLPSRFWSPQFGIVDGEGGGAVESAEDQDAADDGADETTEEVAEVTADAVEDAPADDPAEVVVTIGDEAAQNDDDATPAPQWVRELRKQNRQLVREKRELEQRLHQQAAPAPKLGERPTLAACDYDEDRFATELENWTAQKAEADRAQRQAQEAREAQERAWAERLEQHAAKAKALRVPDFEDAAAEVENTLSVVQRGIIVQGAKDSALLFYALGKSTAKAQELAKINDPVQFAWAVAQMETQLKVAPRSVAPAPERRVSGSAPGSAVDSTLAKLREEADKTGDYSRVIAYKNSQRQKAAA